MEAVHLDGKLKNQFWIPEGFGHGFVVLSETAHFLYKTTNYYDKGSESSVVWNDPSLKIEWGVDLPKLSDKDKMAPNLNSAKIFNEIFFSALIDSVKLPSIVFYLNILNFKNKIIWFFK